MHPAVTDSAVVNKINLLFLSVAIHGKQPHVHVNETAGFKFSNHVLAII